MTLTDVTASCGTTTLNKLGHLRISTTSSAVVQENSCVSYLTGAQALVWLDWYIGMYKKQTDRYDWYVKNVYICLIYVFVQFSDMLVYTSRIATSSLQFKVHGQLSLKGLTVSAFDSFLATSVAELFVKVSYK